MKKFYIVANPDKENTKNMQAAIEKYLKAHGAGVSLGKSPLPYIHLTLPTTPHVL